MNITRTILIRSLVKPFYRQHAALLFFIFIILFGAVGNVDGAGLADFHFSLIRGILANPLLFSLVLGIWLLYAKKTEQFVVNSLQRPEFSFLQECRLIHPSKLFWKLFMVECLLLLPVILYALLICISGIYLHHYFYCLVIALFLALLCLICAGWYLRLISETARSRRPYPFRFSSRTGSMKTWKIFIRFIGIHKKLLYLGIKICSCALLYLMVINQTLIFYDLRMILLFFSLGILGHGFLVHQIRWLEESRFCNYRTVPLSRLSRFLQYARLYFILLLPEFLTILWLTPRYIHFPDALLFIFFCYSLLLFLNSLLFIRFYGIMDYLKIIVGIFFLICIAIFSSGVLWLSVLFLITSWVIYYTRYYRFEKNSGLSGI